MDKINHRFEKILHEPNLLTRFDDSECPQLLVNEADENSRRRICVVNNAVQRRRENDAHINALSAADGMGTPFGNDYSYAQLLFVALIDILCKLNEPCDRNRQIRLFEKIAKTLVHTGVTSPVCFSHQLHGLREHVRLAFVQMMNNARKAVHFEELYPKNHAADYATGSRLTSAIPDRRNSEFLTPVAAMFPSKGLANSGIEGDIVLSRYKAEFEELEQLGKGGFGAVYKVRHYIDSQFYAVKKVKLNLYRMDACLRALREVRSLASLRHSNIVRYYSSWLEFDMSNVTTNRHRLTSSNRQIKVTEVSCESMTNAYLAPFKLRQCLSSPDISSDYCIVDEDDFDASLPALMDANFAHSYGHHNDKVLMAGTLILCLQMELCTSTLRAWINQRNSGLTSMANAADVDRFNWVDKERNKLILRQLLEALAFVHSQGIIHRDLKPGNVFLRTEPGDLEPRVLLGDFGLSCYEKQLDSQLLMDSDVKPLNNENIDLANSGNYRHSTGMGTLAYSAPEQLKSKFYDCKADMFSFGVIAFEMYYPFFTYMERMHKIMRIREGELDEAFQRRLPLEAAIIRQLMQKKASLRPSARQLLDEEVVFVDETQTVLELKRKLKDMEQELLRLRQNSGR